MKIDNTEDVFVAAFKFPIMVNQMKLNIFKSIAAVIIFVVLYQLISLFCLSSFNKLIISHSFNTSAPLHIYYNGARKSFNFSERFSAYTESTQEKNRLFYSTLHMRNQVIRTLRIDPAKEPGTYLINKLTLYSYFGSPFEITPNNQQFFVSCDPSSHLDVTPSGWKLTTTGNNPYFMITGPFKTTNLGLNVLPALAGTYMLMLLAFSFKISSTNLYRDIFAKSPSSGKNFAALDGVRGVAALIVLADHTGLPGFDNMAPVGVVIFFCLSGFLLTMPFANAPSRAGSVSFMQSYLIRRFKRIAPMFYFVALAGYYFEGNLPDFIRSILFVEGRGVKWTVLQEMYFYALLPLLVFLCYFFFKGKPLRCSACLLGLSLLINTGLIPTGHIYGLGTKPPLYFGIFLSGMSMCYLMTSSAFNTANTVKRFLGNPVTGLLLLFSLFFFKDVSHYFHWVNHKAPDYLYHSNFDIIIGIVLITATFENNNIIYRFFKFLPFRIIGILGYSFYLLHPIVHVVNKIFLQQYLGKNPPSVFYFIFALCVTTVLSAITYSLIERPFLRK